MIALIQRVSQASVKINNQQYSAIKRGFAILLGIFNYDSAKDVDKLIEKIAFLRIMSDSRGKMNQSILETKGEILLVSQFTLCADLKKGRRPSFVKAKEPITAEKLYKLFCEKLSTKGIPVKTGKFATHMQVALINDGPVTIILDSNDL